MYKDLERVLKREYGEDVNITKFSPLHDEDGEEAYMVCKGDVMVCRADLPLSIICSRFEWRS